MPSAENGTGRQGPRRQRSTDSMFDSVSSPNNEDLLETDFERQRAKELVAKYRGISEHDIALMMEAFCSLLRDDGDHAERPALSDDMTIDAMNLPLIADSCCHLHVDRTRLDQGIDLLNDPARLSFNDAIDTIYRALSSTKSRSGGSRFPLDPDSTGKQVWDIVVMVFLLYTSFSVPFAIAFDQNPPSLKEEVTAYAVFDLCIDVLFCTDVALCFVTAYTERGVFVVEYTRIAMHYCRTWFLLDFFGSVPFDKLAEFVLVGNEGSEASLQPLRMVRILKLARAVRFMHKLNELQQKDETGGTKVFFSIFKQLFSMVFVAHFLACLFYFILPRNPDQTFVYENWMVAYDVNLGEADAPVWHRYVAAFYWAIITISTVGYGDILPINHEERVVNVFSVLVGGIVFAFSLGLLQQLIRGNTGTDQFFEEQLVIAKQYLNFRGLDLKFTRRVLSYFGTSYRISGTLYSEMSLLEKLPPDLRDGVLRGIAGSAKKSIPLLRSFDDETAGNLLIRLKPHNFEAGDLVYKQRDIGDSMYIVQSGEVEVEEITCRSMERAHLRLPPDDEHWLRFKTSAHERETSTCPESQRLQLLGEGKHFGEMNLFDDLCKYRLETVKTVKATSCFVIDSQRFRELAAVAPDLYSQFRELCQLRAAYMGVGNPLFERMQARFKERRLRPASDLESAIQKYRNAVMEWHVASMCSLSEPPGETPESQGRVSAGRACPPGLKPGSPCRFTAWLRDSKAHHAQAGSGSWTRHALVVSLSGMIRCIPDSVEALTGQGPFILGSICRPPPEPGLDGAGQHGLRTADSPPVSGVVQSRVPSTREEARGHQRREADVAPGDVCRVEELPKSQMLAGVRTHVCTLWLESGEGGHEGSGGGGGPGQKRGARAGGSAQGPAKLVEIAITMSQADTLSFQAVATERARRWAEHRTGEGFEEAQQDGSLAAAGATHAEQHRDGDLLAQNEEEALLRKKLAAAERAIALLQQEMTTSAADRQCDTEWSA